MCVLYDIYVIHESYMPHISNTCYIWHICGMYVTCMTCMLHMWHICNIHEICNMLLIRCTYMTHVWHVCHIRRTPFRIYAIYGHHSSRLHVYQISQIYVAYTIHIWYTYVSYMSRVCDIYVTLHVSDVMSYTRHICRI